MSSTISRTTTAPLKPFTPHPSAPREVSKLPPTASGREAAATRSGLRRTIFFSNGDSYAGEWLDDKPHTEGEGIYTHADGTVYRGGLRAARRHGTGVLTGPDGALIYEGGWSDGLYEGLGCRRDPDGTVYVGQFCRGQREGYGILRRAPADGADIGDWYRGHWHEDCEHGYGSLVQPDGRTFRGEFVRGVRHGPGVLAMPSAGRLVVGLWENNELVAGVVRAMDAEDYARTSSAWSGQAGHEWPGVAGAAGAGGLSMEKVDIGPEDKEEQEILRNALVEYAVDNERPERAELTRFEFQLQLLLSPRHPASLPGEAPTLGFIPRPLPAESAAMLGVTPLPPVIPLPPLDTGVVGDIVEIARAKQGDGAAKMLAELLHDNERSIYARMPDQEVAAGRRVRLPAQKIRR